MESRRNFPARAGKVAAATVAAPWISGPAFEKDQPNVLFVAVGDLNDWIGWRGEALHSHAPTATHPPTTPREQA